MNNKQKAVEANIVAMDEAQTLIGTILAEARPDRPTPKNNPIIEIAKSLKEPHLVATFCATQAAALTVMLSEAIGLSVTEIMALAQESMQETAQSLPKIADKIWPED